MKSAFSAHIASHRLCGLSLFWCPFHHMNLKPPNASRKPNVLSISRLFCSISLTASDTKFRALRSVLGRAKRFMLFTTSVLSASTVRKHFLVSSPMRRRCMYAIRTPEHMAANSAHRTVHSFLRQNTPPKFLSKISVFRMNIPAYAIIPYFGLHAPSVKSL